MNLLTTAADVGSFAITLAGLVYVVCRWRGLTSGALRTSVTVLMGMVLFTFVLSLFVEYFEWDRVDVSREYAQVLIPAIWLFVIYSAIDHVTRQELRQRERRFRRLVEGSWDVICLITADGRVTYATDNLFDVLGFHPREFKNYKIGSLTHPDHKEDVRRAFVDTVKRPDGKTSLEVRARHANGEWRWIDIRCMNMTEDASVGAVVMTFRDITAQKVAQEHLERFRLIQENTSDYVGMATPSGRALYINRAGRAMIGFGPDEDLRGVQVTDHCSPETRELIQRVGVPTALEKGIWSGETIFVARDGREIPMSQVIVAHKDESGRLQMLSTVARDITEQKRAEQAIIDSEYRYRLLAESTPAGIWHITSDGYTVYANPAMCAMLEIEDARQLDGITYHRFFTQDSLTRIQREHMKRQSGQSSSYEVEMVGLKGKKTIAIISGAPFFQKESMVGVVGTFVDVTALRETQESLATERSFSTTAIESLPGIFYLFDQNLKMLRWSSNFERISGFTKDEIAVRTPMDYFSIEDRERIAAKIQQVLDHGEAQAEAHLLTKDGQRIPFFLSARLMMHEGKRCIIGTGVDITEQKRLEEQLRQAQKMESIGQLAGGIAHDFNNLLVAINGYSDVALQSLQPGDALRDDIEEIRNAGERAAALTRQLLAFSRRQVLQPKIVNLNTTVINMSRIMQRLIGEHVVWETDLAGDLNPIKADPGQLEQVIMNLAVNARDAMPDGGKLLFRTANLSRAEVSRHVPVQPDASSYVLLEVRDTGIGMDAEVLEKIFEPFYTTKARDKGTGLGLAMVFGIVKQSGGDIRVESERGKGTAFYIFMPAATPASVGTETDVYRLPMGKAGNGERILVVEDDELTRRLVVRVLRDAGYEVSSAPHPAEALRMLRAMQALPDLILSDVVMPHMNGPELADEIGMDWPEIRILFMSGYVDDTMLRDHIHRLGWPLIQKPFSPSQLSGRVREMLNSPRPFPKPESFELPS